MLNNINTTISCTSQIRVRYVETDQMQVVHHSNYFAWLEIGRTDLLRSIDTSYKNLEISGIRLPLTEAYCKYHYPARYDDILIIHTSIRAIKGVRISFNYKILRKNDEKLLASAYTIHASTDINNKIIPFPLWLKDLLITKS